MVGVSLSTASDWTVSLCSQLRNCHIEFMDPRQLFQNQTRTARQRRHRVLDCQRWPPRGTGRDTEARVKGLAQHHTHLLPPAQGCLTPRPWTITQSYLPLSHWYFGTLANTGCLAKERRGPFQEDPSPACHQQPLGKAARVAPKRGCKWQWIKEGTMAGAWRALVLVAGLAAMACVAQRSLSYEEIVIQALRFFNQGRQEQRLFGLLEAIPPLPSLVSVGGSGPGSG